MFGLFQSDYSNIERISEVLPDADYNQIQHFISESPWDAKALMDRVASDSSSLFSNENSVFLEIDESSALKKGFNSVGVARQYSGRAGKIENCQVAVFGALCSGNKFCLTDAKLYLPQEWTDDKVRCKAAGIPDSHCEFKTKLELALDIVKEHKARDTRIDWVGADGFYGHCSQFRAALDALGQKYMLDIHSTDGFYLEKPILTVVERKGDNGESLTLFKADKKSVQAIDYRKGLGEDNWNNYTIRETSKGLLKADIHVREVFTFDENTGEIRKEILVISRKIKENRKGKVKKKKASKKKKSNKTKKSNEKTVSEEKNVEDKKIVEDERSSEDAEIFKDDEDEKYEYKYSLSNAEYEKYSWLELGQVQAQRYFVERCFEDAKKEVGMTEYQVRGWRAWHHHIALVMLGLLFVLKEKWDFQKEKPLLTAADVRKIIVETYARNQDIYAIIEKKHKQRQANIDRCKMKSEMIT
jgi:SRSO17 transposase